MNKNRPQLGQLVSASDHIVKVWQNGAMVWIPCREAYVKRLPVEGLYIGYRTYANSKGRRISPALEWPEFVWDKFGHQEIWLIVPGERLRPVPVLPKDVNFDPL